MFSYMDDLNHIEKTSCPAYSLTALYTRNNKKSTLHLNNARPQGKGVIGLVEYQLPSSLGERGFDHWGCEKTVVDPQA